MAINIPAYTVPTLSRLGCTFDCHTASPCIEIFPADIPTKTEYVNKLTFKFKAVSSNADVKELMHLPSDFPLRIKANMLSVEGPGKYLNDNNRKIEEEKTEILAVMTCVTVMYVSSSYILKVIYFFYGVLTLPGDFDTSYRSFLCHLSNVVPRLLNNLLLL